MAIDGNKYTAFPRWKSLAWTYRVRLLRNEPLICASAAQMRKVMYVNLKPETR